MRGLNFFLALLAIMAVVAISALVADRLSEIRIWCFSRRLKSMSYAALVEKALRLRKDRMFAEAIMAHISDSGELLRIGRDAGRQSTRDAALARHCLLFGHRPGRKCICEVCKQEAHDFRDDRGRSPAETEDCGEYACTRCNAVFCRKYYPGCKETCINIDCNDGDGQIERYSSQSGQGGSWYEDCEGYAPPSIREKIVYDRQKVD